MPPPRNFRSLANLGRRLPARDFLLPWVATQGASRRLVATRREEIASEVKVEAESSSAALSRSDVVDRKGKGRMLDSSGLLREQPGSLHYGMASPSKDDGVSRNTQTSASDPPPPTNYKRPWRRKSLLPFLQSPEVSSPLSSNHESSSSPSRTNHDPHSPSDPIVTSLLRHNPPPPITLYDHLRSDPSRLSRKRGELVARYASRMSNLRMQRQTKDFLGRMRLGPLHWVKEETATQRRKARRRDNPTATQVDMLESPNPDEPSPALLPQDHSTTKESPMPKPIRLSQTSFKSTPARTLTRDVPPHLFPSSITSRSITSLLGFRPGSFDKQPPNIWAQKRWPVLKTISGKGSARGRNVILTHLHHLLLTEPVLAPDFSQAATAGASVLAPEEHSAYYGDLLHLYLAYTPTPKDLHASQTTLLHLVNSFVRLGPSLRPSRQALHLIILRLISIPESRHDTATIVQDTLRSFKADWDVDAGCETLRHVALLALRTRNYDMAKEAWEGWWRGYAQMSSWADLEAMDILSQSGESSGLLAQSSEQAGAKDIRFKFRRKGRQLQRWWKVVKEFEKRGWIERLALSSENEPTTFRWVPRESIAPQEAAAEQMENKAEVIATSQQSA